MENVQFTKENAIKAYNEGDSKIKTFLINLFGKENLFSSPMDYIKTFSDACEASGTTEEEFKSKFNHLESDEYAFKQLKLITKALNGGVEMDYKDINVYKYYPYFYAKGHAKGFAFSDYNYCVFGYTRVSSRLCFLSADLAIYAGKQFVDIYDKYYN